MSKTSVALLNEIIEELQKKDVYGKDGFSGDKETIKLLFDKTLPEKTHNIVLARLTLIDSMYSTQMNRRYYALDELATDISLFDEKAFIQLAKDYDVEKFELINEKGKKSNLFAESYGIGKDGKDKGIALSLITKYAYFLTNYQFPIYDSIACEMFPIFWKISGGTDANMPKIHVNEPKKQTIDGKATMKAYLQGLDALRSRMHNISYDFLDRILWFVGKIRRGNLSLVLSRVQYEQCIDYLKKNNLYEKDVVFEIAKIKDVSKLPFLEKGSLLYKMFCLAKTIEDIFPKPIKKKKTKE